MGLNFSGQCPIRVVQVPTPVQRNDLEPRSMENSVSPTRTDTASPELERLVALRTQELEQALARAQSLYDLAPCGYLSLDAELRTVGINQTLLNWLNRSREDVMAESST